MRPETRGENMKTQGADVWFLSEEEEDGKKRKERGKGNKVL